MMFDDLCLLVNWCMMRMHIVIVTMAKNIDAIEVACCHSKQMLLIIATLTLISKGFQIANRFLKKKMSIKMY